MNKLAEKYMELNLILELILDKIQKVHSIMYAQEIKLLTPGIEQYRVKYLENMHRHRKLIEDQQSEILDQIDINDIMSVMLQD